RNGFMLWLTQRSLSETTTAMLSSIMNADESAIISASDTTNSAEADTFGGGDQLSSRTPISGSAIPATTIISVARGSARDVMNAAARAYQYAYASTGRKRSYMTTPVRIATAISGSAPHGISASKP